MAKYLMISRYFPSYHPKKGKETFFVEKIMESIFFTENWNSIIFPKGTGLHKNFLNNDFRPKHTTIRPTKRFKRGDVINLKFWKARPYHSDQVTFAKNVKLIEVYDIRMEKYFDRFRIYIENQLIFEEHIQSVYEKAPEFLYRHADMDGLNTIDLLDWFKVNKINKAQQGIFFDGQVICWSIPMYTKVLFNQIKN